MDPEIEMEIIEVAEEFMDTGTEITEVAEEHMEIEVAEEFMDAETEITEVAEELMDPQIEIEVAEELVPLLIRESIGEDCCIFRAPPLLFQTNPRVFKPEIVSIGPYHNRDDRSMQMIEQQKPRFVQMFLDWANRDGGSLSITSLESIVGSLEETIRNSYSEPLQLRREELVNMMILDGCFVLMLVLQNAKLLEPLVNPNDPIFTLPWIVPALRCDLLLLENQVPYVLLETLFEKLGFPSHFGLKIQICFFFEFTLGYICTETMVKKLMETQPRHLLHLVWELVIPESSHKTTKFDRDVRIRPQFIMSAKKMQLQGIKFTAKRNEGTFLDIRIEKNRLSMTTMILDKFMGTFLLNCMALEQCSKKYRDHITSYVVFMGFLMKDKHYKKTGQTRQSYLSESCRNKLLPTDKGGEKSVGTRASEIGICRETVGIF